MATLPVCDCDKPDEIFTSSHCQKAYDIGKRGLICMGKKGIL
jgi:hypothetical protein